MTEHTDISPTDAAPRPARRRRRRIPVIVATLALAVGIVGNAAEPAEAFSVFNGGSTGYTYVNPAEGRAVIKATKVVRGINVVSPFVYRSPATSGTQRVVWSAGLTVWNGRTWSQSWSSSPQVTLIQPGGPGYTQPGVVTFEDLTAGYYRVTQTIQWQDAYGRTLGTRVILMDGYDYTCRASSYVWCQTGPGYVYVN